MAESDQLPSTPRAAEHAQRATGPRWREGNLSTIDLGTNIRARRARLGLTLEALAGRTAVSRAMISDIERGVKSPTVRVVSQIAEGLGCTVSELLGEQVRSPETISILRRGERHVLVDPRSGVERQLLSPPFVRRGIEVVWYVIPSGQATGAFPPHRPEVEEHITVVQGCLQCRVGDREETLGSGDSMCFRADVPHDFRNPGPEPCHYLLIIDSSRAGGRH